MMREYQFECGCGTVPVEGKAGCFICDAVEVIKTLRTERSELRQLISDYWQAMDIYDEDTEEWQEMHHKVRLVIFDTVSGREK